MILVEGVDINEGFDASRKVWGNQPTAITAQFVRALGRPDCLVEIDAIAAVQN
jgi:2-iminobutanoate/2-iminopropanoate deaminase